MSVDPTHDTPPVLKAYADRYGADADRWTLLTGPQGAVAGIAEAGLKLFVTNDENDANRIELGDGTTMANILHPTRLILVGPDRRVQEIYSTSDTNELEALILRANQLGG
jgi:cytochrome oxidase Cu insertion factor (SCO1/SenC/PrrC family)